MNGLVKEGSSKFKVKFILYMKLRKISYTIFYVLLSIIYSINVEGSIHEVTSDYQFFYF